MLRVQHLLQYLELPVHRDPITNAAPLVLEPGTLATFAADFTPDLVLTGVIVVAAGVFICLLMATIGVFHSCKRRNRDRPTYLDSGPEFHLNNLDYGVSDQLRRDKRRSRASVEDEGGRD